MLMEVNKPLAAPSANRTNQISPTTAIEVLDEFGEDCPPILDGGNCDIGLESTVLDLSSKKARVLRLGPISAKEIEIVLKQKVETPSDETLCSSNTRTPSQESTITDSIKRSFETRCRHSTFRK
jgi:L-threonylcarbamoyladenylate synthase